MIKIRPILWLFLATTEKTSPEDFGPGLCLSGTSTKTTLGSTSAGEPSFPGPTSSRPPIAYWTIASVLNKAEHPYATSHHIVCLTVRSLGVIMYTPNFCFSPVLRFGEIDLSGDYVYEKGALDKDIEKVEIHPMFNSE